MNDQLVVSALDISTVTTIAEFDDLRSEWEPLFRRSNRAYQICQAFGWLKEWAKSYLNENTELAVIVARRNQRIVSIWPLVKQQLFGMSVLSWMGHPLLLYGDALVDPDLEASSVFEETWKYIASSGFDILALNKVPCSATIAPLLARLDTTPVTTYEAPFLQFEAATDFDHRCSGKAKARRRKQLRDLEQEGPVTFECCEEGERLEKFIRAALAKKREWAASRKLYAYYLSDPNFETFLIRLASATENEEIGVRAVAMYSGSEALGIEIALKCRDVLFGTIISIDEKYGKRHVGELLADYAFREAFASGCRIYDLYMPSTPFKMRWADSTVVVNDWAFAFSLRGRMWLFARPKLLALFSRLPVWLRRRIGHSLGNV